MDFSSFLNIIQMIIILIIVIFAANISLKFINKNMFKNNKLIKIIEKVPLSNTSSLGIVEVCGNYYLMSFTGSNNKILKELDKDEIEQVISNIEESKDLGLNGNILRNILGMRDKN